MRALNVNDFIFDLDRVKAVISNDSEMVSLIEKLQYMVSEYEKQHSIEAEPVRHGRWIPTRPNVCSVKCSICEKFWETETPYCPSCGAKMDLEE